MSDLNGWTVGGALSVIGSAAAFIWRTRRQVNGNPNSLLKRIARWSSATGRVPLVEDALDYTTNFNRSLLEQRAQWISERTWYEAEIARLHGELNALRSSPSADSSPGSSGGSTGSGGANRRKRRTSD